MKIAWTFWTFVMATIGAVGTITTAWVMITNFFGNRKVDRMRERLAPAMPNLPGQSVCIEELLQRGVIERNETGIALKTFHAMVKDGVLEVFGGAFYVNGYGPHLRNR